MERLSTMILKARELHKDQIRRYTGEKYEIHLAEVAALAMMYYHYVRDDVPLHVYLAVAWWHDAMEDQGQTFDQLYDTARAAGFEAHEAQQFAFGVVTLSDIEGDNREDRNAKSRFRLTNAELWLQLIKCADLESNTKSIFLKDPDFFQVYCIEKNRILKVLTKVDPEVIKRLIVSLEEMLGSILNRPWCPVAACDGVLMEDTRPVLYRTIHGNYKSQKDVRGLFCTHCNHIQLLESRGSTELKNRHSKGRAFFGTEL